MSLSLKRILVRGVNLRLLSVSRVQYDEHPEPLVSPCPVPKAVASTAKECAALCGEKFFPEPNFIDSCVVQPKIAIVGAGIAGLAAAYRLTNCGLTDVTVYEALSRPGGRIHSCAVSNTVAEMGAQWLYGATVSDPTFQLACMQGIVSCASKSVSDTFGLYFRTDGEAIDQAVYEEAGKAFTDIRIQAISYANTASEPQHACLYSFFNDEIEKSLKKFSHHQKADASRVMYSLLNGLQARWGTTPKSMSLKRYGSYSRYEGRLTFPGGLNQILIPLVKVLKKEQIQYKKPVKCIRWSTVIRDVPRGGITFESGEEISADYVICTAPLGVLKHSSKFFNPRLPEEKLNAIDKIGFGISNRVFLQYDKPFWVCNEGFLRPSWTKEELSNRDQWVKSIPVIEPVPCSNDILQIHVGGDEARCIESIPETELVQEITKVIRKFLGDPTLPFPKAVLRSAWIGNKYFRGTGTYYKDETRPHHIKVLSDPIPSLSTKLPPVLLFAGEATSQSDYASMRGAYLSGIREANRIIELTRNFGGPPRFGDPVCFMG